MGVLHFSVLGIELIFFSFIRFFTSHKQYFSYAGMGLLGLI